MMIYVITYIFNPQTKRKHMNNVYQQIHVQINKKLSNRILDKLYKQIHNSVNIHIHGKINVIIQNQVIHQVMSNVRMETYRQISN